MNDDLPPERDFDFELRFGRDLHWWQVAAMAGSLGLAITLLTLAGPLIWTVGSLAWLGYLAAGGC